MIRKIALTALLSVPLLSTNTSQAAEKIKVGLEQVATGFTSPLNFIPLPDDSGRALIADQIGVLHLLEKPGQVREKPVLDLRPKMTKLNQGQFDERGLLGLALHPNFKSNQKLYLFYSAPSRAGIEAGWDHTCHISEFVMASGEVIDPSSEKVLLQIDKPYFNHSGGRIAFGPDGFLYIGVGDGGNANDTGRGHSEQGNGQDTNTLLGKILRIDINSGQTYSVPNDNPFKNGGGKPEIFAYGIRNPWGISFDRGGSHQLFVADVGQNMYEEINIVEKGGNYGWRVKEAHVYFDPNKPNAPAAEGATTGKDGRPFRDPILSYKNFKAFPRLTEAQGTSVTGGYVYRGKAIPELAGQYVFADWSRNWGVPQGVLFNAKPSADVQKWEMQNLDLPGGKVDGYVVAMGEGADGELYVLTNGSNTLTGKTGKVWKIVPASK